MTPAIVTGIIISILTLGGSSVAAYVSVKTDIAVNTTTIKKDGEQQQEKYEELREGQQTIEEILREMQKELNKNNG